MAQVAASALATMVGALLASELGVAGTVIGAAVVSVAATTSTAVFHHIFRRTGDQLRVATDRGATVGRAAGPAADPGAGPAAIDRGADPGPPVPSGDWNSSRVLRSRPRWTWKSYAAASGLVFVLAMVPIVGFELATGQPVSATVQGGTGQGTSFGGTVHGTPSTRPSDPSSPAGPSGASPASPQPSPSPSPSGAGTSPSAAPSGRTSPGPSAAPSTGGPASADPGAPVGSGAATPSGGTPAGGAGAGSAPAVGGPAGASASAVPAP